MHQKKLVEKKVNPRLGSKFSDWLDEEGFREEVEEAALKQCLAWRLEEIMKEQGVTKTELAKRMKTSRNQVNRILDPKIEEIGLHMIKRACTALGKPMTISIP